MTKIFQKSLAIVLSLIVIITTSGLNIYTHSCGCCQSFDVSITAFDECCDHTENQICKLSDEGQSPCCEEHAPDTDPVHECRKDGCCRFDHQFLKMAENFDRPAPFIIQYFEPAAVVKQILSPDFDQHDEAEKLSTFCSSLPPPSQVGKAFIIFAHSLKIAPSFHISA